MALEIKRRPFAIEPITGIMLPDGIFDAALSQQRISCYLTNTGDQTIGGLAIWIKAISDPGISVPHAMKFFGDIAPGASVLVAWDAGFVNASPGKVTITFACTYWFDLGDYSAIVGSLVKPLEITKDIFVTRTTYDAASRSYSCTVPQGTMKVRLKGVTGPKSLEKWKQPVHARKQPFLGPLLLRNVEFTVQPVQPYTGTYGDLPFQDPWWKVVAWVVFVVALVAAVIAAAMGYGTAYIGLKGEDFVDLETGDPACYNCEVDTWGGPAQFTAAGVLSIIAMLALAVGLMDEADPWRRGQAATATEPGEQTKAETVSLALDYPDRLVAGRPFPIKVNWHYERRTDQRTLSHEVEETVKNSHVLRSAKIYADQDTVKANAPLTLNAQFIRPNRRPYTGDALYVYALITAPTGNVTLISLQDENNDGVYRHRLVPAELAAGWSRKADEIRGPWKIYVCAQDTNAARPDMTPIEAAKEIGGYMVYAPFQIATGGDEPCPESADVVIEVT